jgi:hypothetical protein
MHVENQGDFLKQGGHMLSLLFSTLIGTAQADDSLWFGRYSESLSTCYSSYFLMEKGSMTIKAPAQDKIKISLVYIEDSSCLWMYNQDGVNVGKFCFINAASNFSWFEAGWQIHGSPADYVRLYRCD